MNSSKRILWTLLALRRDLFPTQGCPTSHPHQLCPSYSEHSQRPDSPLRAAATAHCPWLFPLELQQLRIQSPLSSCSEFTSGFQFNVIPTDPCIWKHGTQGGLTVSWSLPLSLDICSIYRPRCHVLFAPTSSLLLGYQTIIPVYIPQGLLRPNKDNASLFYSALVRPLWWRLFICGPRPWRVGWGQPEKRF